MYGVQIAFRRFNATAGITKSPWVGMYYFERFFNSPYFASTIKNTLILSLYGLVVSFPIPIILALMLNSFRHKRYRKVIQTVTYAPNFISTVVMCGMIILFLSPSVGVINHVLEAIGIPAVNFMAKKAMEDGDIIYAGKYSAPDYEMILNENCGLAIENTMILHTPEVKEQMEKFNIPVLVDHSSYETNPLGRTEWVKLYGMLTGHEDQAEQAVLVDFYADWCGP